MRYGILSHERAAALPHQSVASEVIQDRRRWKRVPNGTLYGALLHSYVNLYFDARNPMLSRLLYDGYTDLVILRVSQAVLDIPGTIVTDGNAACNNTRFLPSPGGLCDLNRNLIFADDWTDPVTTIYWEKKRIKNAEVLVPGQIDASYILGCYVSTTTTAGELQETARLLNVTVNGRIYFR